MALRATIDWANLKILRITLAMETLWIGRALHAWQLVFKTKRAAAGRQQPMAPRLLGATATLLSAQLPCNLFNFGVLCAPWMGSDQARRHQNGPPCYPSAILFVIQNLPMQNHRYRERKNGRQSKSTDLIKLALHLLAPTCAHIPCPTPTVQHRRIILFAALSPTNNTIVERSSIKVALKNVRTSKH